VGDIQHETGRSGRMEAEFTQHRIARPLTAGEREAPEAGLGKLGIMSAAAARREPVRDVAERSDYPSADSKSTARWMSASLGRV
jgi:hypothetical protein